MVDLMCVKETMTWFYVHASACNVCGFQLHCANWCMPSILLLIPVRDSCCANPSIHPSFVHVRLRAVRCVPNRLSVLDACSRFLASSNCLRYGCPVQETCALRLCRIRSLATGFYEMFIVTKGRNGLSFKPKTRLKMQEDASFSPFLEAVIRLQRCKIPVRFLSSKTNCTRLAPRLAPRRCSSQWQSSARFPSQNRDGEFLAALTKPFLQCRQAAKHDIVAPGVNFPGQARWGCPRGGWVGGARGVAQSPQTHWQVRLLHLLPVASHPPRCCWCV